MSITKRFVAITLGVATVAGVGGAAFAVGRSITADVPEVVTLDTTFQSTLTGAQEVGGGDPDGTGFFEVTIDAATDQVCVTGSIASVEPLIGLHIHRGIAGVNGPIVVPFAFTGDASAVFTSCAAGGAVTDEIIANPLNFYVNAHTPTYPNGAVRGQVEPSTLVTSILPTPLRAYDSRQPNNVLFVPALAPNSTTTVDLSTAASPLPPTAVAALVTVTVTETTGLGFLTVYSAALTTVPATSTVNWTAPASDVATTTSVKLSPSGEIKITLGPNGGADVIIDVIGYLSPESA